MGLQPVGKATGFPPLLTKRISPEHATATPDLSDPAPRRQSLLKPPPSLQPQNAPAGSCQACRKPSSLTGMTASRTIVPFGGKKGKAQRKMSSSSAAPCGGDALPCQATSRARSPASSHQLYPPGPAGSHLQRRPSQGRAAASSASGPVPEARTLSSLPRGATPQRGWPRSGLVVRRPLQYTARGPEDAGLTFLLYPFPFPKDESVNLWQFPPRPLPSTARRGSQAHI